METPGQRTASAVLDLIDGAIDDYTSPDAMRWTPNEPVPLADLASALNAYGAALAENARLMIEAFNNRMRVLFNELRPEIEQLGRCIEHLNSDGEPTDPMERALWLRRNRNTGPAVRQRAPKRIEARRART